MRARAPGKLVLSGAYSVLEGAPAVVTAVNRYARADTERPAQWVSEEVKVALGSDLAPYCDASELRAADRKLGLGSSAAILVASLAAIWGRREESPEQLQERIFPTATESHRQAQKGGSGIDVAAATFGGTLICRRTRSLKHTRTELPPGLQLRVFASQTAASTRDMLQAVRELQSKNPRAHARAFERLGDAAKAAVEATQQSSAESFIDSLAAQVEGFLDLGAAAHLDIVTDSGRQLWREAERVGGVFAPAGAGGGDVSFWAGTAPMPERLILRAQALGWTALDLSVGASGAQLSAP